MGFVKKKTCFLLKKCFIFFCIIYLLQKSSWFLSINVEKYDSCWNILLSYSYPLAKLSLQVGFFLQVVKLWDPFKFCWPDKLVIVMLLSSVLACCVVTEASEIWSVWWVKRTGEFITWISQAKVLSFHGSSSAAY